MWGSNNTGRQHGAATTLILASGTALASLAIDGCGSGEWADWIEEHSPSYQPGGGGTGNPEPPGTGGMGGTGGAGCAESPAGCNWCDVDALLTVHTCNTCHASRAPFLVSPADLAAPFGEGTAAQAAIAAVQTGDMPPAGMSAAARAEFEATVSSWVEAGMEPPAGPCD
jgi:hypothetical protein